MFKTKVLRSMPMASVTIEATGTTINDIIHDLPSPVSELNLTYGTGSGGTVTGGSGISDLTFDIPINNLDGVAEDVDIDTDGDGILNVDETGTTTTPSVITITFDGDGDGIDVYLDLVSNNVGSTENVEARQQLDTLPQQATTVMVMVWMMSMKAPEMRG